MFSFFFSENENLVENSENNNIVQEEKIEIKNENKLPLIEEEKTSEEKDLKVENEIKKEEIKEEITPIIELTNVPTKEEIIEEEKIVTPSSAKLFLQELEEKVIEDVKTKIDYKAFVSIRVTVLKNGNYEQLTLMDGDKKYFNLIKPILLNYFPLKIDDSIKNEFPRYFRLKIEK